VVVRYRDGARERESRFSWRLLRPGAPAGGVDPLATKGRLAGRFGIDVKTEIQRRVLKLLYSPESIEAEARMADRRPEQPGADPDTTSRLPDVFSRFGSFTTAKKKKVGYIRIRTFNVNPSAFFDEFLRLVAQLPRDGLILDVRGNGGGVISAGEMLLQLLTPHHIEPAAFSFLSSPLTLRLCEAIPDLEPWQESLRQSIQTAAAYSQGFPLTPEEDCNAIGQKYQGPVVLITDALCYSTTDIFAAGFQDHRVGPVLGVASSTGAGGANVWTHDALRQNFQQPDSPFQAIQSGAAFRVALRRAVRVGKRAGVLLEDLGVTPDGDPYRMTKDDVLKSNVDLYNHAADLLAAMPVYSLRATVAGVSTDGRTLKLDTQTSNLDRLDVLVDGRPWLTLDVKDGPGSVDVPVPSRSVTAELHGFQKGELRASTRVPIPAPRGAVRPEVAARAAPAAPLASLEQLMAIPPEDRKLDWIKTALKNAIRLEFATIPPYLCGMWSVKPVSTHPLKEHPVYGVIRGVVVQEMGHMGLASNLLTAVGELPQFKVAGFVPDYPCELPGHVHPGLVISLVGLSQPLVKNFWMQIEQPEHDPVPIGAAPGEPEYPTIGAFYDALLQAFHDNQPPLSIGTQLQEDITGVFKIATLDDVDRAITQIKQQGEGTSQSAFAEGFGGTLAHYYCFQQIVEGKRIIKGPDGKAKWGAPLPFPAPDGIYPMAAVPHGGYPSEITGAFNQRFSAMLGLLQDAWAAGGDAGNSKLQDAIDVMGELKKLARAILEQPLQSGGVYGPDFRLV
jgi:hypothetical protein